MSCFYSELRKADRCFIGSQLVLSGKFFRQITQPKKISEIQKLGLFPYPLLSRKNEKRKPRQKFLDWNLIYLYPKTKMLVCNRCLLFKSDSPDQNLLYHIGNCGHVFCSNCRQMYQGCFVCQNHEARFTAIDENLRSDMKLVLTSPEVLCRAFEQSLSFQNMHMTLFQDSTEQKINAMQKAVQVIFFFFLSSYF